MLKGIYVEDSNLYVVKLPHGEYMVDGEAVKVESYGGMEVQLDSVDDIRKVSFVSVPVAMVGDKGQITLDEYEELKKDIPTPTECGDYDSLEDEFKARKFNMQWRTLTKQVTQLSDPIPVAVDKVMFDTGSKYITPIWSTSNLDDTNVSMVMVSSRSYVIDRIQELCKQYDLTCQNSNSGTDFIKVQGDYIFGSGKGLGSPAYRTSFELAKAKLEDLDELLQVKIKGVAAKHRGLVGIDGPNLLIVRNMVNEISSSVVGIDSKQKTWRAKDRACTKINELKQYIENALASNLESDQ
jgi:hypothetical protein